MKWNLFRSDRQRPALIQDTRQNKISPMPHETDGVVETFPQWEVYDPSSREYGRCAVDLFILTHADFLRDHTYATPHTSEYLEALALLDERYKELKERDKVLETPSFERRSSVYYHRDENSLHHVKIQRIIQEWMNQYFIPRVQTLTLEEHTSYLQAKIENTDLKETIESDQHLEETLQFAVEWDRHLQRGRFYNLSTDEIEMAPLYGSSRVALMVASRSSVKGRLGHTEIADWSKIDAHDSFYQTLKTGIGKTASATPHLDDFKKDDLYFR